MEDDPSEMLHKLVLEEQPPVDQLTDCLRSLRNSCVGNSEAQSQLGQQDMVLQDASAAINLGLSDCNAYNEDWTLCLRISAQFLGNLIVNNPRNQKTVWDRCCLQLKRMTQRGDAKLTNICMMVLYNILLGSPNLTNELVSDQEFIRIICKSGADGFEFAEYIVEHMLTQDLDWDKIYNTETPIRERLFVLDVMDDKVKQSPEKVPSSLTQYLALQFSQRSDCILRTVADRVESLEPLEVSSLLRVLASCSPHQPHCETLQADKSFIINCAFLLRSIHSAGKEGNNCFSAVPKLSAVESDPELATHPAFGFKASLIQVLGNLSWKNRHNQDMMRELEIIPLLLDCCNIDARNPFIIQWVVLAVRNLCEDNQENQAVIAGMSRQGLVESSVLSELGMTLHTDGDNNQIRIAPLDTSKR